MSQDSLSARLLAAAASRADDSEVAFLCAWLAVTRLVRVLAWRAGVRAQFSLRQNGTLRTHREGAYKLPELTPAREEHQWRAALGTLSPEAVRRVLAHPNVRILASRTPTLNGRPVLRDGYGQRLKGVIDAAMTRDRRYPVWHTVATAELEVVSTQPAEAGTVPDGLWQVGVILRAIASNLMAAGEDDDAETARLGLPVVLGLAAGLQEACDQQESAS